MEINYYDLLEVAPTASEDVIRAAFKVMQKRMHPDRGGNMRLSQIVNLAKETLLDPDRRRQYDARLDRGPERAPDGDVRVVERIVMHTVETRSTFVVCVHCHSLNRVGEDRLAKVAAGKCGKCGRRFGEPATIEREMLFAVCQSCGKRNPVGTDDYIRIRELDCRRCGARLSADGSAYAGARQAAAADGPAAPAPAPGVSGRPPVRSRGYQVRKKSLEQGLHLPGFEEGSWEVSDLLARLKGTALRLAGKVRYVGRRESRRLVVRIALEDEAGGILGAAADEQEAYQGQTVSFAIRLGLAGADARQVRRLVVALER